MKSAKNPTLLDLAGATTNRYNATVYRCDEHGQEVGVFLAEVDEQGRMLRSNWLQFTGLEGMPSYDVYLRRTGHTFRVVRDGG